MKINFFLKQRNLDAFCVPSCCDEFLSEYVDQEASLLYFLSGFSSSNCIIFFTNNKNILLTDSRYILQAQNQMDINKWEILNMSEISISSVAKRFDKIGIIASFFSKKRIETFFESRNTVFLPKKHVFADLCFKPKKKVTKIFDFDERFCGISHTQKLKELRKDIYKPLFLANPESICWLFNIRGDDLENTPIVNCFALILKDAAIVFSSCKDFQKDGVIFRDFSELDASFDDIHEVLLDKNEVNGEVFDIISNQAIVLDNKNLILAKKCIKNSVEISGFINAHKLDGKSISKLISWAKKSKNITEFDVVKKSYEFRQNNKFFHSPSFDTIAGFNKNGAVIHYKPDEKTSATIEENGVLLIDSGGQYFNGTTDCTRTIAIGDPELIFPDVKRHYTLVLKSLIMLSNLHFPLGVNGVHLDAICRYSLWQNGLDFAHGTGHGVGHFLSVHEGPCSISKSLFAFQTPLSDGMILSIEPGLYFEGKYGIRLENLVLVEKSNKFDNFLQFKTLTKAPFDRDLIDFELLSIDDVDFLNNF